VEEVVPCDAANQNFVVYFEWDSSTLTSQASAVIDQAVANVSAREDCTTGTVTVVGHTDSSGQSAYNLRLSARRASIVAAALEARGIDASLITADGRGETELAVSTRDGVREPLNRRSEVTIIVE
jgi:outer membrane protein OmpA-like peptidoglycan-associated protein